MERTKGRLTPVVFILIIMTDIIESFAELFFKKATIATGISEVGFSNFLDFFARMSCMSGFWLGMSFYVINFFLWIAVLSQIDLSVAFPTGSTSYIIVALLSIFFLGEQVSPAQWAGIIFIIAGIFFISRSTREEEK
jgi:drug/metabolite transporter (DMT)-like permease